MHKDTSPIIVISTEVGVREQDGNILLAHRLASLGFHVYCLYDQYSTILCHHLGKRDIPFILIDKSASVSCLEKRIRKAKTNKNSLVYIQLQESFINLTSNPETRVNWLKYFTPEADKYIDGIFSMGNHMSSFIQTDHEILYEKTYTFGNPRIDLLCNSKINYYEDEIAAIQQLYGDFILFNDSHVLPEINNSPGGIDLGIPELWKKDSAFVQRFNEDTRVLTQYNRTFVEKMYHLLNEYSKKNQTQSIVVRPHPTNKPEYWMSKLSSNSNIYVCSDLPVEPWILASRLVITDGCTTGLQALVAGKPSASLEINSRPSSFSPTMSKLSNFHISSTEGLEEAYSEAKRDSTTRWHRHDAKISDYMINDGESSSRIAQKIYNDSLNANLARVRKSSLKIDFWSSPVQLLEWKWQHFRPDKVKDKIKRLNIALGSSCNCNEIGWNSYYICRQD